MKQIGRLIALIFIATFCIVGCEDPIAPTPDNSGEGGSKPDQEQTPGNENEEKPGDEDKPGNEEEPKDKEFVILFTNDFHSQIEPLSKEETYNADRGGV